MNLELKDKVALVAASSQGLGKAVAMGLAREGAKLALCARGSEALEATASEIRRETGAEVFAAPADVTAESRVRSYVDQAIAFFGKIDICVANAGGPPAKPFEQTSSDEWRRAIDLNFLSTLYLAQATLPLMKQQRWGRFVAITSISIKQPLPNMALSNSVRSAVTGLMKTLSTEYAPHNVLVNNVCPGYTATARLTDLADSLAKSGNTTPEEVASRWTAQIPLGRLGNPQEFADAVVFLCSERASYITGVSLAIDGGFSRGLL